MTIKKNINIKQLFIDCFKLNFVFFHAQLEPFDLELYITNYKYIQETCYNSVLNDIRYQKNYFCPLYDIILSTCLVYDEIGVECKQPQKVPIFQIVIYSQNIFQLIGTCLSDKNYSSRLEISKYADSCLCSVQRMYLLRSNS